MEFTQEQLNKWYLHKSNKEKWIEEQQRKEEELEELEDMLAEELKEE